MNPSTSAAANPVGSMGYDIANNLAPGTSSSSSFTTPAASATPINVDSLGKAASTPIAIPPATVTSPAVNTVTPPAGSVTDANGNATTPPPATPPATSSISSQIQDAIAKVGTEGAVSDQLNQAAGTDQLLAQKNADYNAYNQAKIDQTNTIASMRENNPQGQDKFGLEASVAKYQMESDAHISNLAVQSQVSSDNYAAAEDTISKKLDAQFTPLKDQVTMLEALNTTENNDMTDSEKMKAQTQADQLKTDSANVQTAAHDIQTSLLKNGTYATAAPKIDAIVQDYSNGKLTAAEAQSKMYAAASPYGVANLSGAGGISAAQANLPQVSMTANNVPDPQAQAQFLASLPKDVSTLVQGLANYTINPSTFATRLLKGAPGMTRADAISLAKQYDPTFDETQYASRQALRTNFESGKYSQNINSLNTAVGHLADIPTNFDKLGNGFLTPGNAIKNTIGGWFGFGAPTSAKTNINAAAGELASTFRSGGATEAAISDLGNIDANSSPSQMKNYVQTSVNLLASRLNALQETYASGMGKAPASSFLSPTASTALSNLKNQGYDVNVKGVYFTDPTAYVKADPKNQQALSTVRSQYPSLTPAQATQYAQYLQENGQL